MYDGSWIDRPTLAALDPDLDKTTDHRSYLVGGLGLLMDKQYYDGNLPEPLSSHGVVGWFSRQQTSSSGQITMLFTFDQGLLIGFSFFRTKLIYLIVKKLIIIFSLVNL